MALPYFKAPKNDGQRLLNLQYEYKTGRAEALGDMYKILFEIAYKTINALSKNDANIKALEASDRQQKAHDAATYVIEQYLKRPDFSREKSITGYLFPRIRRELYYSRKCDKMLDYRDELPQGKAGKTYRYIVKDMDAGTSQSYASAGELYLNPEFRTLRKCRLAECIRTGRPWKKYTFDLLEVNE